MKANLFQACFPIIICCFLLIACNPTHESDSAKLEFSDTENLHHNLDSILKNSVTVFVFLSPECPMCENYSLELNKLYNLYSSQVKFYGVFSGKANSLPSVKQFKKEYAIQFSCILDFKKTLCKHLNASVTPEVFVFNNSSLIYNGAIDNWLIEPGQKRSVITEHYLEDVLFDINSHQQLKHTSTQAKGCLIE